jgi:hypothetical protein
VLATQLKYSRRTEEAWFNAIPKGNGAISMVHNHMANRLIGMTVHVVRWAKELTAGTFFEPMSVTEAYLFLWREAALRRGKERADLLDA